MALCLYLTFRSRQIRKYSSSRYSHTSRARNSGHDFGGSIRTVATVVDGTFSGTCAGTGVSAVKEDMNAYKVSKVVLRCAELRQCMTRKPALQRRNTHGSAGRSSWN